jgi:23S rRNA (cytosine1962-C5)-methyltransferase
MVRAAMTARVYLKPGHVRPVYTGHPWVFQQAVARIEGGPIPGDEVVIVDPQGKILGRGLYSPGSAIPVRLFTQDDRPVDAALLRARIEHAAALRRSLGLPSEATNAYRLVHGEGDGLPGLIVDVFGDVACVQLNTVGIARRQGVVFDAITEATGVRAILDRTSESASRVEGVPPGRGIVRGDEVTELAFRELGLRYALPLGLTQKTGYYLDQRSLRARVAELAAGRDVLDAYAFVGSFALSAARGGARRVVLVDQSALAVELAGELARANGLERVVELRKADAVEAMEDAARKGGFELVLCDPPKLAPTRAKLEAALTAYRRVARAAARATKPGGLLVLSSCSAAVGHDELVRALAMGARDANLRATVIERHVQGPDHPVPAAFPEGLYLKSVVARIDTLA